MERTCVSFFPFNGVMPPRGAASNTALGREGGMIFAKEGSSVVELASSNLQSSELSQAWAKLAAYVKFLLPH